MASVNNVPVIDLQGFPGETAKLIEACEEWGCFRIVNFEGILSESVVQEMRDVVKALLEMPAEVKERNVEVVPGSGYMAPSKINPLYESLCIYDASSPQAVEDFCSTLEASPIQRDVILKYAKAVNEVLVFIGSKIGEGLGVEVKGGGCSSFEDWCCQFKINRYHFRPETVGFPGVQLHTDSSLLTLVDDDKTVGGLEVMKKSGEFEAVDPIPGTLVVNLGDIATVWSNGRFNNVKHRVMCKEAGTRLSIASFLLGPRGDGVVEAPSELVDSDHPRLFPPFTYLDYKTHRMSNYFVTGETVDCFRIQTPHHDQREAETLKA